MKRSCFHVVLTLIAVAVGVSGCAAASEPCDKLLKRVCAAGGDALCEEVRAQHASRSGDAGADKKCQTLLDDPARLGQMLDGLRAASLLKVSLSGEPDKDADVVAEEVSGEPEAKGEAKPAAGAAPPAKPKAPAAADGS